MAAETNRGNIRFWHPWHMEITHEPHPISFPVPWENRPWGDIEWPHSLARFTHMLDLAAGSLATHSADYLATYRHFLADYQTAHNPENPFWQNRLDSALRITNLIRAHDLMRNLDDFTIEDELAHQQILAMEGALLASGLGTKVGNWEFFIVCALLMLAEYCPNDKQAATWSKNAQNRLQEILANEILSDGFEIETTPMYHGVVVLAFLDLLVIYGTTGSPVPPAVVDTVTHMLQALNKITTPNGTLAPIGDSDALSVSYLQNFANVVMERIPSHWVPQENFPPSDVQLETLEKSGWSIVRWPSKNNDGFLLFDASPLPPQRRRWHSHNDALQILLHGPAGPLLTDPGRFTYTENYHWKIPFLDRPLAPQGRLGFLYKFSPPDLRELSRQNWRAYFKARSSHNTLSFKRSGTEFGLGPDEPTSPALEISQQDSPLILLSGSINNFQRTVVGFLPWFWLIIDCIETPEPRTWTASWHFVPEAEVSSVSPDRQTICLGNHRHHMVSCISDGQPINAVLKTGWVSTAYNQKQKAPVLDVILNKVQKCQLATVITMPSSLKTELPQLQWLQEQDNTKSIQVIWKRKEKEIKLNFQNKNINQIQASITNLIIDSY